MNIRAAEIWNRFWFAPAPATGLAGARIVIGGHALWMLLSRDLPGHSALPAGFWAGVSDPARWRYLLFPGHPLLETVVYATAVLSLLAVIIGVRPRAACLTSALLLYHLAPLETIIWTPNPYERGFDIAVIALVALAASPCADVWALGAPPGPERPWRPDYNWPLRLIELSVAQIYLFSGYAKLYRVGFEWIAAENIRRWLLVFTQQDQVAVFRSAGSWLAQSEAATLTIAVATIGLDLIFIMVVFWRRSRMWLLPMAAAFHLGILVTMNIAFLNAPQLLVFVDWESARRRVHRWRRRAERPAPVARRDPAAAG